MSGVFICRQKIRLGRCKGNVVLSLCCFLGKIAAKNVLV